MRLWWATESDTFEVMEVLEPLLQLVKWLFLGAAVAFESALALLILAKSIEPYDWQKRMGPKEFALALLAVTMILHIGWCASS